MFDLRCEWFFGLDRWRVGTVEQKVYRCFFVGSNLIQELL